MGEMKKHMDDYIKYLESSNYAKNTIIAYEINIRYYYSYLKQFNIDYKAIKGSELIELRNLMYKRYKISTINSRLYTIRHFYNYLIDIDKVTSNPIRQSLFIRSDRKRHRALTQTEETELYKFMGTKYEHVRLAFKVFIESGVRLSELIKLKERNFIEINDKYYIQIEESKNKNYRLVPIEKTLYQEIKEYINKYTVMGTLFNLSERGYQYHAEQFQEKTGIQFSIHSCRHTYATRQARKNIPIQIIQKMLGHKNINTTMYYITVSEQDILNL